MVGSRDSPDHSYLVGTVLLDNSRSPPAGQSMGTPRSAAWYAKSEPTFVDAIALVRRHLWNASATFCTSPQNPDMLQIPTPLFNRFIESLAYAA